MTDAPSLQEQIDAELDRYRELTEGITALESSIDKQIHSYEDILNSYLNAIQIVQPKMDSWRNPRREKIRKMCLRLQQKWSDAKNAVRSDQALDQDEQLFSAVLRIHYKRPNEQQAFQRKRQKLIQEEIEKLNLRH